MPTPVAVEYTDVVFPSPPVVCRDYAHTVQEGLCLEDQRWTPVPEGYDLAARRARIAASYYAEQGELDPLNLPPPEAWWLELTGGSTERDRLVLTSDSDPGSDSDSSSVPDVRPEFSDAVVDSSDFSDVPLASSPELPSVPRPRTFVVDPPELPEASPTSSVPRTSVADPPELPEALPAGPPELSEAPDSVHRRPFRAFSRAVSSTSPACRGPWTNWYTVDLLPAAAIASDPASSAADLEAANALLVLADPEEADVFVPHTPTPPHDLMQDHWESVDPEAEALMFEPLSEEGSTVDQQDADASVESVDSDTDDPNLEPPLDPREEDMDFFNQEGADAFVPRSPPPSSGDDGDSNSADQEDADTSVPRSPRSEPTPAPCDEEDSAPVYGGREDSDDFVPRPPCSEDADDEEDMDSFEPEGTEDHVPRPTASSRDYLPSDRGLPYVPGYSSDSGSESDSPASDSPPELVSLTESDSTSESDVEDVDVAPGPPPPSRDQGQGPSDPDGADAPFPRPLVLQPSHMPSAAIVDAFRRAGLNRPPRRLARDPSPSDLIPDSPPSAAIVTPDSDLVPELLPGPAPNLRRFLEHDSPPELVSPGHTPRRFASGNPPSTVGLRPRRGFQEIFGGIPEAGAIGNLPINQQRRDRPIYGPGFLEVQNAPRESDLLFDPTQPQRRWDPASARPNPSSQPIQGAPVPGGPPPYWCVRVDQIQGIDRANVAPEVAGANALPAGASALPTEHVHPGVNVLETMSGAATNQAAGASALSWGDVVTSPTPNLPSYRAETTPPPPYSPEDRPPPYSLEPPSLGPPDYLTNAINNLNRALRYSAGIERTRPDHGSRLLGLELVEPSLSVPQYRALRDEVLTAPLWHADGPRQLRAGQPIRRLSLRAVVLNNGDYGARLESIVDYRDARLEMDLDSDAIPDYRDARIEMIRDSDPQMDEVE